MASKLADACAEILKAEEAFNNCDELESQAKDELDAAMARRKNVSKQRDAALTGLEKAKAKLLEAV